MNILKIVILNFLILFLNACTHTSYVEKFSIFDYQTKASYNNYIKLPKKSNLKIFVDNTIENNSYQLSLRPFLIKVFIEQGYLVVDDIANSNLVITIENLKIGKILLNDKLSLPREASINNSSIEYQPLINDKNISLKTLLKKSKGLLFSIMDFQHPNYGVIPITTANSVILPVSVFFKSGNRNQCIRYFAPPYTVNYITVFYEGKKISNLIDIAIFQNDKIHSEYEKIKFSCIDKINLNTIRKMNFTAARQIFNRIYFESDS